MKRLLASLTIVLAAAGCQKPDPVIVDPGGGTDQGLEITKFSSADTSADGSSVDSTGVPPDDAALFSALLLVSRVEYDVGPLASHVEANSLVYFADRSRPFQMDGKTIGYYGMDLVSNSLLPLTINNLAMFRVPYRLRYGGFGPMMRDTVFGSVFVRDVASIYQPNMVMTWRALSPAAIDTFTARIITPDNIRILSPAGGSVLRRTEPLVLRWEGRGNLIIVISVINPVSKKTFPIMKLRPRLNTGSAVIDPRILHLLHERFYVLSFILSNRYERMVIGRFPGMILVQAASIHNSYVELQ